MKNMFRRAMEASAAAQVPPDYAEFVANQGRLIERINTLIDLLTKAEGSRGAADHRLDDLPRELIVELQRELRAVAITWALAVWAGTRKRLLDYGWKIVLSVATLKLAYWTHTLWALAGGAPR